MSKLIQKLKYQFWHAAHTVGLDVYPKDPRNSVQSYLSHILKTKSIDCVWDIGANTGQYALMLRNIGYCGNILSFEPIQIAWDELQRNAVADPKWAVYERCAVGLTGGEALLNVTADSVSSSLLRPINANVVAHTIRVKVERLDSIIGKIRPTCNSLLKLDCQGSEYDIVLSASNQIALFLYVQMEASIYPLYEEEKNLFDLCELMDSMGFNIAFMFPGITDFRDRLVQVELIFKRR